MNPASRDSQTARKPDDVIRAEHIGSGRPQRWSGLACWLIASYAAAAIGGLASLHAADFYTALTRPHWSPPAWLFGPVWSVLYTLMGVAVWLVWREGAWHRHATALNLFVAQLAVNASWSWLFFAWHMGVAACVEIVVLWWLIIATTIAFWRVRAWAGVLMLPYLAWVGFASALSFAIWYMNPALLS
jgi:translocator protein